MISDCVCVCRIWTAWDEGVFELIDNALKAWPEGCEGAYICCLSNPQNLNIGKLLGTKIESSPFHRILVSDVVRNFVMLSNNNTPIHSRLWVRAGPRFRLLHIAASMAHHRLRRLSAYWRLEFDCGWAVRL